LLYAEGNYMATPRLMINAKVYKEVSVFDEPVMNPRALTPDGEGVSVGFNYLINEHTSIGAAFFGNPFDTGRQGSYFGRPGW